MHLASPPPLAQHRRQQRKHPVQVAPARLRLARPAFLVILGDGQPPFSHRLSRLCLLRLIGVIATVSPHWPTARAFPLRPAPCKARQRRILDDFPAGRPAFRAQQSAFCVLHVHQCLALVIAHGLQRSSRQTIAYRQALQHQGPRSRISSASVIGPWSNPSGISASCC